MDLSASDVMRKDNLVDSVTALRNQAEKLIELESSGSRLYGGTTIRVAIAETLKSMIVDCSDMADRYNGGQWALDHRQWASNLLRQYIAT